MENNKILGSEAIIKCLLEENVETIFGYPGGAIMPVYDALFHYMDKLNHILVRHEQGAIHAAQGYARTSGKTGVVFATSGPGATNLITGLADAMIDSTPVVCITGQVASHLLGTDAFQETDVVNISTPVTKWNYQVTSAEEIPMVLAKAFYIANSGRPGPVVIDIAKDAQQSLLDFSYEKCNFIRSYQNKYEPDEDSINQAAQLINNAKKPLVLFGQGVILAQAEKEFKEFIEKAGLPSAWTLLGLSALDSNHPLNVGMLGMHGNYAPNLLTNQADVIVAIGMRFDDRVTGDLKRYAKQAKVIHLELDPSEINKNVHAHVPVLGDCKISLQKLLPLINKNNHSDWRNEFAKLHDLEVEKVIEDDLNPKGETLNMAEIINKLNQISEGKYVIVTDVGQHQMITCRYAKFSETRSNITSGGLGTMGFALPAAIGAKLGDKKRTVIAIAGDGGFQMNIQELGTIAQFGIGVKMIILNNSYLGMVRQWQEMFFDNRYSFVNITSPDFPAVAKAYGIKGKTISKREEVEGALKELFADDEAYLLEIKVGRELNVFPMIPTGSAVDECRLQ
ncbi:MAG: biosynthetic-type acetolactate synthase large subunit [Flavobacteriales bacterium]|nr:biosynthetic-type acetolactate synthase large subunit [Flavobacteriales bacterium]